MSRHDPKAAVQANEQYVIARLEAAGATLLALPQTGFSTRLRSSSLDIVRNALDSYSFSAARIRPPVPSGKEIDEMEQALGWIPMIPSDRYVLRRIVGARTLVNPMTGRHVFAWRRLATSIGTDHKSVQRWHAQGIAMIVAAITLRK
jgi:hypothetical protein